MKKRRELIPISESSIEVIPPFPDAEVEWRHGEYTILSNKKFDFESKDKIFEPIIMKEGAKEVGIQYNFCSDTFCPNYGEPYRTIKPRGKIGVKNYSLANSKEETVINCSYVDSVNENVIITGNSTILLSNWSIAQEIKRLKVINSVRKVQEEYVFHKDDCLATTTPFENENSFYKRGTNKAGSQKYQCKSCKKITSVRPSLDENFSFGQKRNDVLLENVQPYYAKSAC